MILTLMSQGHWSLWGGGGGGAGGEGGVIVKETVNQYLISIQV